MLKIVPKSGKDAGSLTPRPPTESQDTRKPVFIRRGEGMSFEEFKKVCIQRFMEAGLLSNSEKSSIMEPDEDQIRLHNLNEKWLREQFPPQTNNTQRPQGKSKTGGKR